eukprot:gene12603-6423_t
MEAISWNTTLKKIHIFLNFPEDNISSGLKFLSKIIENEILETLSLSNFLNIGIIKSSLIKNESINSFNWNEFRLSDNTKEIGDILSLNHSIETLILTSRFGTSEVIDHLIKGISNNNSIKNLIIKDSFGGEYEKCFHDLKNHPTIETLDTEWNSDSSDSCISNFCNFVIENKNVKRIRVSNLVTPDEMKEILQALEQNEIIQEILPRVDVKCINYPYLSKEYHDKVMYYLHRNANIQQFKNHFKMKKEMENKLNDLQFKLK